VGNVHTCATLLTGPVPVDRLVYVGDLILLSVGAELCKLSLVGRLVVVIDVNPSHWFWTPRLMKVFGNEGKCK
jgi:hypothetical protein